MNLSNPVKRDHRPPQGLGTIQNDEGVPALSIGDVMLAEDSGSFTFTVVLSAPSAMPVGFAYATADGTATAGSDYTAATSTGAIAPGSTSASVIISVTGDATFEPDETFFVNLSAPTGATIADGQGLGTILNDDAAPTANLGITKSASSATFTPG